MFPLSIRCFYFMCLVCSVSLFLFLCFLTFTSSPSSSPFSFWPGLLLLHSHCIQQILESVNHCHINGIVHRDLKVSKWQQLTAKRQRPAHLQHLASLLHCLINRRINLLLSAASSKTMPSPPQSPLPDRSVLTSTCCRALWAGWLERRR